MNGTKEPQRVTWMASAGAVIAMFGIVAGFVGPPINVGVMILAALFIVGDRIVVAINHIGRAEPAHTPKPRQGNRRSDAAPQAEPPRSEFGDVAQAVRDHTRR